MKFDDLQKFINNEHGRLIKFYGKDVDHKERLLSRTVKVTEEVGELANEILISLNDQRKSKRKDNNSDELSGEFADVLITTLLLAKEADVDIEEALENKIKKIEKRKY
jgi:NTP pyrophosphatase (non-canonical NTP hydrolase)